MHEDILTHIRLAVENPGQVQISLEERERLFGIYSGRFEDRFSFDVVPERARARILLSAGHRQLPGRLLEMQFPFEFRVGLTELTVGLPYEVGPERAEKVLDLLCDIAEVVEGVSKAPIVGIDVEVKRD